ncbi:uncharacterized protein ARMOST_02599 [Armillaria ostoyae]|uniref:Uncharacterized protein n=1 Tax=Armillaria ostoyae TaxID=47428 RepID=A0A284QS63_ARMOS|nr:uncharacterized protein ARMOST_02599 [Armillaria ostoyae]
MKSRTWQEKDHVIRVIAVSSFLPVRAFPKVTTSDVVHQTLTLPTVIALIFAGPAPSQLQDETSGSDSCRPTEQSVGNEICEAQELLYKGGLSVYNPARKRQ